MKLTKEQLYADLHSAYLEARRHKRSRDYQQRFERDMYWQLKYLCDGLTTDTAFLLGNGAEGGVAVEPEAVFHGWRSARRECLPGGT